MAKTIGLQQLAAKKYILIEGMPVEFIEAIGMLEDAFDAIIYGASGNGKSNFTVKLLVALIKALNCKCEYVAYEEGHGFTMQNLMLGYNNVYEQIGNNLMITDHYSFDELKKRISRRKSAKIWVIDSLQAARFTAEQCAELKQLFVLSKKRKIIIYISWSDGKFPSGATAKSVEYYANIKMRVDRLIMFPKSRYGGNKPFVIWEEGALAKWGKDYWKVSGKEKPKRGRKKAEPPPKLLPNQPSEPVVTHIQIAKPQPHLKTKEI